MSNGLKKSGFSLTEVLLAVGTLAIGLIFIGGTFVAGLHFSTIATERTIAAVAADEAFAKIRIYNVNLASTQWQTPDPTIYCVDFNEVSSIPIGSNEFAYPSTRMDAAEKQYFWSALCRREGPDPNRLVQVTVFVSRKVGAGTRYRYRDPDNWPQLIEVLYPQPVDVSVVHNPLLPYELSIIDINPSDSTNEATFINDGDTIVDDENGQIYRVLKRYPPPDDNKILLDRPWEPGIVSDKVWVVPPPVGSGRKPCIVVYQKGIRF